MKNTYSNEAIEERPISANAQLENDVVAAKEANPVRERIGILLSLLALYIVWGSTYLGMRIALEGFPPFLLAGLRFLIAGSILYAVLRVRGVPPPGRKEWAAGIVLGALLLVG